MDFIPRLISKTLILITLFVYHTWPLDPQHCSKTFSFLFHFNEITTRYFHSLSYYQTVLSNVAAAWIVFTHKVFLSNWSTTFTCHIGAWLKKLFRSMCIFQSPLWVSYSHNSLKISFTITQKTPGSRVQHMFSKNHVYITASPYEDRTSRSLPVLPVLYTVVPPHVSHYNI